MFILHAAEILIKKALILCTYFSDAEFIRTHTRPTHLRYTKKEKKLLLHRKGILKVIFYNAESKENKQIPKLIIKLPERLIKKRKKHIFNIKCRTDTETTKQAASYPRKCFIRAECLDLLLILQLSSTPFLLCSRNLSLGEQESKLRRPGTSAITLCWQQSQRD